MWNPKYLTHIDFRAVGVIVALMFVSLITLSSYSTLEGVDNVQGSFFTPLVKRQIQAFIVGGVAFVFLVGFDYNKLREWAWILYVLMIIALIGLFFTGPIHQVHRWYRFPLIGFDFQPSEYAKLSVVISLSWFLERRAGKASQWSTAILGGIIAFVPFILILKQPDLGSALVLFPVTLGIFYFGNLHPTVIKAMTWCTGIGLAIVLLIFSGAVSHEEMRPYATKVLKSYQYDRFDPDTHHQKASVTAIAVGGFMGKGWRKGDYKAGGWLPAPHTDSVFPAFGEEFGFVGLFFVMVLFYTLIYLGFQVTAVAKDHFGRLLAAGITMYLAMHVLVNIGMMTGFLPITGVPLILVTYGGSSILATMVALGILQSIYSRRFVF